MHIVPSSPGSARIHVHSSGLHSRYVLVGFATACLSCVGLCMRLLPSLHELYCLDSKHTSCRRRLPQCSVLAKAYVIQCCVSLSHDGTRNDQFAASQSKVHLCDSGGRHCLEQARQGQHGELHNASQPELSAGSLATPLHHAGCQQGCLSAGWHRPHLPASTPDSQLCVLQGSSCRGQPMRMLLRPHRATSPQRAETQMLQV